MNFANSIAAVRALQAAPAQPATPAPSAPTAKTKSAQEQAAESAKYLKADIPSIGKPTWNYWDGAGRYANITGADGKEYMFVPDDYVRKGLVSDGTQLYNKQFLDPATFKNAVQYSLPKEMQSVVNRNGYVWAVDDYNRLGLGNANGYTIDANNPAILGLGNPHPSMQQGSPISYITQPKLAPGGERVQQDWITAADGRQGGLGQYAYYKYQGPFADMARGALKELGPLTPILLDVFAGPGTGAIYSMSRAAGEASMTGDWNKAATTIGTIMAAPYVTGAVAGAVGSTLDMGALANGIVGNAVGNAVVAGLTGGDPVAAMVNSGVGGAVGAITGKIDGFSELPPSVQRVFNATLRAELSGKDPSKAAILAATTAGLQAIKNGMDANDKFQKNYGREATAEELNNFAHVSTQEELNSSFDKYMADTAARSQAEAQEKIDEAEQARLEAFQKAQEEDAAAAAAAQVEAEQKAREAAEAEESARQTELAEQNRLDEAERLRQAGLTEISDREAAEAAQVEEDRLAREKADSEASARQAAIDEQNRLDEVERLRQAGLQENANVDLNKVVAGDATDEDAEQARRVAEFGKDLTGGGSQDLGEVDTDTDFYGEDSTGMGAYKYDPTSGTYTYTSDDGSTLTLDGDGNIVGSTESTDTAWTGITDPASGNLKLPKLPTGKQPAVKPPAKKITTTGTGNTATTTGSSTVVQTGGGLNMAALMAIMGGMGGNQQPQQAQIETYDPGKGFEYFDWESDPFAPKTKDKTNPTGQPKMAGGGSVDEILEILRRSGI
jgi:hypothetical protein